MPKTTATKRLGGQIKDGTWLVLTESTGNKEIGYKHNCGGKILGKSVDHPIWDDVDFPLLGHGHRKYKTVPYCPKCEEKPNLNDTSKTPKE